MDPRYMSPDVTELWSDGWTYAAWLAIETRVLVAQRNAEVVPLPETNELVEQLYGIGFQDSDIPEIKLIEERTRHDVVAFLEWLREPLGDAGRWIHFGLTSSDVVDTTQGMRFRQMHGVVLDRLGNLMSELTRLTLLDTPVIGRTHGQVAEPMTMQARAWGWLTLLATGAADLSRHTKRCAVAKVSGPVGTYAHNPPDIENQVAATLNLRPHGPGATQIASRAPLAAWAASANLVVQACAKVAHDIRLMDLTGETKIINVDGQVGSSSMAHKQNPIRAERIEGLARMAEGYAGMLGKLGTWLERDISQSSVERVAVPDLWHVTIFAIEELTMLLRDLMVTGKTTSAQAYVSWWTLRYIEGGMSLKDAREAALIQGSVHPFDVRYDNNMREPRSPMEFMQNYPAGPQ